MKVTTGHNSLQLIHNNMMIFISSRKKLSGIFITDIPEVSSKESIIKVKLTLLF